MTAQYELYKMEQQREGERLKKLGESEQMQIDIMMQEKEAIA